MRHYAMLETGRWTQQDLTRLQEFFLPLEPAEYAMEKAFKGEYLFMKNTMNEIQPAHFLDTISFGGRQEGERFFHIFLARLPRRLQTQHERPAPERDCTTV